MILADFIALAIVILFAVTGVMVGFGKGLELATNGLVGIIISIVACYFFLGMITEIGFVQNFMLGIVNALKNDGAWYATVLLAIRIDVVCVAVITFVLVQLVRILIINIIRAVAETDLLVMKIINKVLGAVLFIACALALALIVFQIIAWIGGETAISFASSLKGSAFALDGLFEVNPLKSLIDMISII